MNLPANIPLNYVAVRQMTAEEQSDKMASDMEVRMKERCVTEFLHAEKFAPNDTHPRLLNVYGDQTVDVSTIEAVGGAFQQWRQRRERQATFRTAMHSCHAMI